MSPALGFETERHLFYALVRTLNVGQSYDNDSLYLPRPGLPLKLITPILRHAECTVPSRISITHGRDEFKSFQEETLEVGQEGEGQEVQGQEEQGQEEQEQEEQEQEEQEQEEQEQVSAPNDSEPGDEDDGGTLGVEEDMDIPGAFPVEQDEGDGDGSNEEDGEEPQESNEMDNQDEETNDAGEVEEAVSYEVSVFAWEGDAHEDWFKSPSLGEHDLASTHSVQLITISRDQGWTSDPNAGSWSWFDLIILQNDGAPRVLEGETLAWKSHDNGPPASPMQIRPGLVFGPDHVLWRHLRSGDQICVRACARFSGWSNTGTAAILNVTEYFVPSFVPK